MECIFCKIVRKEQPADILFENDEVMVFRDINPKAPVHVLIVPKRHIASVNETQDNDAPLLGIMLRTGAHIAGILGIRDSGYKLIFNVGRGGGQVVDHVHLHVLGGWKGGGTRELP